jgi:hypothetical protein
MIKVKTAISTIAKVKHTFASLHPCAKLISASPLCVFASLRETFSAFARNSLTLCIKQAVVLFLLAISINLHAQDEETTPYTIHMISRATRDSIMLRWAPGNFESWQLGNKNGYIVERYTILKDNKPWPDRTPKQLNPAPIKPIPVDRWEQLAEYDNYAGVAAQAIYGESFDVEAGNESPAIAIFNKATEQQNRYSFALFAADNSVQVAKGMGLMYTDKNVVKGEKYLYVVYFAGTTTLQTDTAYTFTGPDEAMPLQKPTITQTVPEDRLVTLEWMAPSGRAGYTAFDIQRSDDGGKTYKHRNTSPLINTSVEKELSEHNFFMDTLPENNKKYIYRVCDEVKVIQQGL